tara:strand:+ start:575 stop:1207 length:633 start_codon:yes stop_codon:yes gene_type:complete
MISKRIQSKSLLAKLFENGIRILLFKECKNIGHLEIDIIASSIQIIKGEIQKINLIAKDIYYKDLLFDKIELDSNLIKVDFNIRNKKLNFKNHPKIKFKISISEISLKKVLLSHQWNWIGKLISKEILDRENLEDIKIRDGKLLIKASETNIYINKLELVNIKTKKGKVYLYNKNYNKKIQIPIEDKIYIENLNIENNLINIFANSSISF